MRFILGKVIITILVVASLGMLPSTPTAAVPPLDPAAAGTTPDNAAGSCWEIKQLRPSASSGTYWLLTPQMSQPQQFYCDQETDGGGWVLLGKGREGWTTSYEGRGQASDLLSPAMAMGPAAYQHHSRDVDALLGGGRVADLTEGVRIRRATNTTGTQWQEARVRFAKMKGWAWTLGSEHPLTSWSFGTTNGSSGSWRSFGSNQLLNRMVTFTNATRGWRLGYGYGSSITGENNNTSYLWAPSNGQGGALPFSQVYLRPRILSTDGGFSPIPDAGSEPVARKLVTRSTAMVSPWGVNGVAGSTGREGNVEVQAFAQSGNTMYVGGNFRYVQQDANGTGRAQQSFLAAFDVDTGQWISTFRPALNEQVRSLATLPDGTVVAAGDFSQANGQPATAIVALDPTTGATRANWSVTLENRITGGTLTIRTLDVSGDFLYIGGAVTHFSGGSAPNTFRYMRSLGRVSITDGTPSAGWNPEFNGTVDSADGSQDLTRVYASGFFTQSQGVPAPNAAAVLTAEGADLATPAWTPTWSANKSYQQAIKEVGDRVWVGGSEHNLFSYDTSDFTRLSGEISKNRGGDLQAIQADQGVVYAGSHASDMSYADAYFWPTLNADWTDVHTKKWVGAWDAETGERIPEFVPNMGMRLGAGIWEILPDSNGTIWMGGDITTVQTNAGGRFSGGFARFPMVDATSPGRPGNFRVTGETASTVSLAWSTVSDAGGGVRYQVLLDDRTIAFTSGNTGSITVPKGGAGRYFVRAVDGAGNVGASTSVLKVGSGELLPTASFEWTANRATADFDASASSSPSGDITSYSWDFGDGSSGTGATATHSYAAGGEYLVRLTVTDVNGAQGTTSQAVTVGDPPAPRPADVYGGEVYDREPWLYYRLNEPSGPTVRDFGPDRRDGTYSDLVTRNVPGALANSDDPAVSTTALGGFAVSPRASTPPAEFTVGVWFRTTALLGGRLIGYASSNTGLSNSYDRHLFVQDNGQVVFGVWNGRENRVTSPGTYDDGTWHYAVASLSPAGGMRLYLDGELVGSNPNTTAESFLGYWKVGGDRVWAGASSNYLDGAFDEAVVYLRELTSAQVAEQWRLGSTMVAPPENTQPTASFTTSMDGLTGTFNAGGSSDQEGPIQGYAWDFGDGNTGSGQVVNHTYAEGGGYTVTLTVTDSGGLTDTTTRSVTAEAQPVEEVVVANGANWRWRYETEAPPSTWKEVTFDASSWKQGEAILGFGSSTVTTDIDGFATTQDRARAAYFRRTFEVADASRAVRLELRTVADDGVVVHVNGTEVARANMPDGEITHMTFASSARREWVANASPVVVEVPLGLLRNGTNVIAAQTHLNYRGTADVTFDLQATLTHE